MKSRIVIVLLLLIAGGHSMMAQSCCCTGAGSNYSILPNLNKHIIGLHYTHTDYQSKTQSLNSELDGMMTYEHVNTVDLFGRFNLVKQLQLSVFLPVSYIREHSTVSDTKTIGLGDMSFLLQYSVLDPLKCNGKTTKHQLRFGIGTKLPSGEFKKSDNNLYSTSVQLGTGSIDFLANAIYTFRYKKIGINAQSGYKLNTTNTDQFKFGDKVDGSVNFFYVADLNEVRLMPSAGVTYAHTFENRNKGQEVYLSYSDFVSAPISMDIYYKRLAITLSGSPVIYNRVAFKGFKQRYSVSGGVFYNF